MKPLQVFSITILCALLSACVSARPIRYYRIEVPAAAPPLANTKYPFTLAVGTIDCPSIMRDGRILYQLGAHEVGTYEYHRWVETPDRLVQNSFVSLLRSSGQYPSVDVQRSSATSDYILAGKIFEFAEIDNPEIHTRVSMEIELRNTRSGRIVWSRIYTHEAPVVGKKITDVVESLDQNLRKGLSEIVTALQLYFDSAARAGSPPQ